MAQFEIIDDFTFEVCLLYKEKAFGFVDYLESIGIKAKLRQKDSNHYVVLVASFEDSIKAKQALLSYANSPFDSKYTKASWDKLNILKSDKQIKANYYYSLSFDLSSLVTIAEILCILLYVVSLFNEQFVLEYFALSKAETFSDVFSYYKLLTPTFVHFSIMHIAFNLVMFESLGRPLERVLGRVKFFSLFISIALLSNVLQYCFINQMSFFGGLSGVVYGIIGYSGLISLHNNNQSEYAVPKGLLSVSVIFIGLGFFMDGIANLCHLGGLVVGMAWALFDLKKRNKH